MGFIQLVRRLRVELAKFGAIGALAYVIDVGIFNALRFSSTNAPLYDKPLTAKFISVVFATTFAYFGNRYWTFRQRQRTSFKREYALFFLLNGIAMGIALACLGISHYVLQFTSPLADNISANVVGLLLSTAFRFWGYHNWVFQEQSESTQQ